MKPITKFGVMKKMSSSNYKIKKGHVLYIPTYQILLKDHTEALSKSNHTKNND